MEAGYLGVGNMGQPMAAKLLDGGHSLTVFDISEAAMEPLLQLAIAQGEELGVPMWVCEAARLVFKLAMHKGAAKTAIVKYVERDAGFELPKTR